MDVISLSNIFILRNKLLKIKHEKKEKMPICNAAHSCSLIVIQVKRNNDFKIYV